MPLRNWSMLAPFACSETGSRKPMRRAAGGFSCAPSGALSSASDPARKERRVVIEATTIIHFMPKPLPKSIDETQTLLAGQEYVSDRSLATALFLSLAMRRPLFLEGEAGVGKTEIAKVLAKALDRELIRLQ